MSEPLTPEQEKFLLRLARQAVTHFLKTGGHLKVPRADGPLEERRGAFVTLKIDGKLRGCIGYPLPYKPLVETIIEMAVAAASQDPRFRPLTLRELDRTTIEISVLGLPEEITDPRQVEVCRHGLIISKGPARGLLLPQVPVEHGWDRETFLRNCCLKAGIGPDEWKKGAKMEVFTAQVFSE